MVLIVALIQYDWNFLLRGNLGTERSGEDDMNRHSYSFASQRGASGETSLVNALISDVLSLEV